MLSIDTICPPNIPQSIYEDADCILVVYNTTIKNMGRNINSVMQKQAKDYFIDAVETMHKNAEADEKPYWATILNNFKNEVN